MLALTASHALRLGRLRHFPIIPALLHDDFTNVAMNGRTSIETAARVISVKVEEDSDRQR
jgi:hypothetical protein